MEGHVSFAHCGVQIIGTTNIKTYGCNTTPLCFFLWCIFTSRLMSLAIPSMKNICYCIMKLLILKINALWIYAKKKKWTNFGWGNFWSQPVWFGSPLLPELKCESHKRPQMDFHCQNKWSGYRGSIAYLSIALHHFSQHLNKLNSALYQPVCINSISAPKQITLFPNKSSFCADI